MIHSILLVYLQGQQPLSPSFLTTLSLISWTFYPYWRVRWLVLRLSMLFVTYSKLSFVDGTARGRLRNALIADSDDFAPIMGGGRFQLQTEDQESGKHVVTIGGRVMIAWGACYRKTSLRPRPHRLTVSA